MALMIGSDNNPRFIFDHHFALKCPHCSVKSNISAISIPRYEFLERFRPDRVGIAYRCDSCNEPIFLRFPINNPDFAHNRVVLSDRYEEIERPMESFEYSYLPQDVQSDFKEALTSYAHSCFNAFAAMCRRTVQSVAVDLGAAGKDKVTAQLVELKAMAHIDDEVFDLLKQIVVDGHDGAHPHLPSLNQDRAAVLLELMKDVLYQVYVRKGKVQEAMDLRTKAIADRRNG